MRKDRIGWIGVGALGAGVVMGVTAMGPLDPPAGPVEETSPSLAAIEAKIDSILSDGNQIGYERFALRATSENGDDVYDAIQITNSRVLLHKIIVYRAGVTAFDGFGGAIESDLVGRPTSGNDIGHAYHQFNSSGTGRGSLFSHTVEFNTIAENGLHLAYDFAEAQGYIQVLYRELEDTP